MRIFSRMMPIACGLALVVSVAQAQGSAEGGVSAGGLSQETSSTGYMFGDFSLRGARGPWQASIGMFGVVGRLHETYADISYDTGTIRTSIGFPRPAYDIVATSALTNIMPRLALESIGISRSRATYGTMFEPEYLPYGAVVSGEIGALRYAMSLHGVPDYDVLIAGSGVSYQQGDWHYDLGVEAVNQNDTLDWNAKAKLQYEMERFSFGVGAYLPRANGQPDALELSAIYNLTERMQLSGMTRHLRDGDATQAISAQFAMTDAWNVEVGAALTGGEDTAFSAALAFAF